MHRNIFLSYSILHYYDNFKVYKIFNFYMFVPYIVFALNINKWPEIMSYKNKQGKRRSLDVIEEIRLPLGVL